ncbi:unnamed protein product [Rhizoctonia solani]|nr:unnamed protein product [Rhizoctonia solani]
MSEVREKAALAKKAAQLMNRLTTAQKNEALLVIADALLAEQDAIIAANALDLERGRGNGTSESLLDRLTLTPARIAGIAEGLRQVETLADPVGLTLESFQRPNGLLVEKISVPLGVIGMIYEARPNVTVDAAALCLKTGNAVVLRGGSAALESNRRIVGVLRGALAGTALPPDALQLVEDPARASVDEMLKLNGLLDVVIPRGGAALIRNVVENATVPVIETGAGICHTFVDASAAYEMAADIAFNAKVQRPSVCNAMETLLVHEDFAEQHLRALADRFRAANVELRGCERTRALALAHIARFGTMHSESIVTDDEANAAAFMQRVDAAAVYHNASTRFTDGFEFGFGAEIGISTQKLHARGPMGLPALTSTKFRVYGSGQVRN